MSDGADPVEALVATVYAGRELDRRETQAVIDLVRRWVSRRPGLLAEDHEEIASDAVLRLLRAAEGRRLDPHRPPGAWLRVVADHLALDRLRRRRPVGVPFDEHVHQIQQDDDRIAALLDGSAAARDVADALREAADAGEHEMVRLVSTWLDLAASLQDAPTTRDVAARSGVSHMTVSRSLRAFAPYLSRNVPRAATSA